MMGGLDNETSIDSRENTVSCQGHRCSSGTTNSKMFIDYLLLLLE